MVYQTFKKVRETHTPGELYPTGIPEELQTTIANWFDSREVCGEDELFIRFFRNVLNRDFKRYEELIRIEPGYALYDWLVQNYQESQTRDTKNSSSSGRTETTSAGTTTTSTEGNSTERGGFSESGRKQRTGNIAGNKAITHGHKVVVDSEQDTAHGHKVVVDSTVETSFGRNNTRSGSQTNASSGGEWSNTSEASDNKELSKDNPQSSSYSASFDIGNNVSNAGSASDPSVTEGGNLDWTYPGAQRETSDMRKTGTKTGTNRQDTTTYNDVKDQAGGKDTVDTDSTTTNSGTDKVTVDSTTTNSGTDLENNSESTTETENETRGGDNSKATTEATDSTVITGGNETQTQAGSTVDEGLTRFISTGRSIDTATLLQNAVDFISATSAWEWLKNRLSVCFIGVYDV
ncbi:MAG: hypothetical protein IKE94_04630 [Aeriscardovia sp.]|nr:hypothetical protein [Aeriscardovia sp.]